MDGELGKRPGCSRWWRVVPYRARFEFRTRARLRRGCSCNYVLLIFGFIETGFNYGWHNARSLEDASDGGGGNDVEHVSRHIQQQERDTSRQCDRCHSPMTTTRQRRRGRQQQPNSYTPQQLRATRGWCRWWTRLSRTISWNCVTHRHTETSRVCVRVCIISHNIANV